jgi:acetylornithine deacetylase/succinyl-diaminopimelate desuccinylase-like protein
VPPAVAGSDVGRPGRVIGWDNWHDGATFTRVGGTPCVCFGPGDVRFAHTVDEPSIPAVEAMRFCGR